MILVTGSSGLVGRHLCAGLERVARPVRRFDVRGQRHHDVCDPSAVEVAMRGVSGVVHLAAVSRVIDGERDPDHCRHTNLVGLRNVIGAAIRSPRKPWFVFVSSREIYGNVAGPADEDTRAAPRNTYAWTKLAGEHMTALAREAGLCANICRLSTVYGALDDYPDRVVPAFCRAAAAGGEISVHGADVVLDPTHISDVSQGLATLVALSSDGERLPPIHLVGGRGISLRALADLAVKNGVSGTRIALSAPRTYGVTKFIGDPGRAKRLLGWTSDIGIEEGVAAFVRDFRDSIVNGPERLAAAV